MRLLHQGRTDRGFSDGRFDGARLEGFTFCGTASALHVKSHHFSSCVMTPHLLPLPAPYHQLFIDQRLSQPFPLFNLGKSLLLHDGFKEGNFFMRTSCARTIKIFKLTESGRRIQCLVSTEPLVVPTTLHPPKDCSEKKEILKCQFQLKLCKNNWTQSRRHAGKRHDEATESRLSSDALFAVGLSLVSTELSTCEDGHVDNRRCLGACAVKQNPRSRWRLLGRTNRARIMMRAHALHGRIQGFCTTS